MFNPANQTHFSLTLNGQRHDLQVLEFHGREAKRGQICFYGKHPRHSERPSEIRGFISALPVNWTRQEYNNSTFSLTVLAQIEPRPSAGPVATALAGHFPSTPDNEAT